MPVPAVALFGKEMLAEMTLDAQPVLPAALETSGFSFAHPGLEDALRVALA